MYLFPQVIAPQTSLANPQSAPGHPGIALWIRISMDSPVPSPMQDSSPSPKTIRRFPGTWMRMRPGNLWWHVMSKSWQLQMPTIIVWLWQCNSCTWTWNHRVNTGWLDMFNGGIKCIPAALWDHLGHSRIQDLKSAFLNKVLYIVHTHIHTYTYTCIKNIYNYIYWHCRKEIVKLSVHFLHTAMKENIHAHKASAESPPISRRPWRQTRGNPKAASEQAIEPCQYPWLRTLCVHCACHPRETHCRTKHHLSPSTFLIRITFTHVMLSAMCFQMHTKPTASCSWETKENCPIPNALQLWKCSLDFQCFRI